MGIRTREGLLLQCWDHRGGGPREGAVAGRDSL